MRPLLRRTPRPARVAVLLVLCLCTPLGAQATKARLQSTANGDVQTSRRPALLLSQAQTELFDGHWADAASAFGAVLSSGDVQRDDTLSAWAYHGVAIARALSGDRAGARASYDKMLRLGPESPLAIADSIEATVLTGQRQRADALIARFLASRGGVLPRQYAHSFRALSFLLASRCDDALREVASTPDPDRPLPQAIRGVCALNAGHRKQALAVRDSVLHHPLADPSSWPMIVARGVALKIH